MEIRAFAPQLEEAAAVDRTDRLTVRTYLSATIRELIGRGYEPETVTTVYYPDYLAYTTVELDRLVRGERTVRFLVGIDGITGRVGEVDVDPPDRVTVDVSPASVLPAAVSEDGATDRWRDWIFPYLDRTYRPVRRPESTIDRLELVYTPFYVVDYGDAGERYAVSALTRQVELLEDIEPLEARYDSLG
ncbi:hypothetical protein [Halalkalicoccus sp. NIPERK01]|uniref:hypothetical protein n=1 Tax=Halalkalicoccus sp. NIPERK01 TaxID=3053469 RepID=UPI00256EB3FB|nr:hypothetical protein [Halalkalicoccus sp. NIPERK01]MDL5363511.1 hypothetical protein [Halalkalicoccus sp. NIPERK01]